MKNKSVVKRKILTVVIGLLLLISYILGNIEMGKLGSKVDYVNLLSQGDENGMTYSLAESAHQRNQQSDEPLQFVNWCQESGGRVSYKELNRMEAAEIMAVYGRTDLLFSDCEVMDIENKNGCLISKGLAFRLLGGTDVVGNILEYNSRKYEVIDVVEEGNRLIQFKYEGIFEEILDKLGQMPLPPYITHQLKDKNRYQTVYAKYEGSAAAPTAGLHFTKELLNEIKEKGVEIANVTLHVGLGTFRPVKVENVLEHHMHSEFYDVEEEEAKKINECRKNGGRVIAVGTTSCRTLESVTGEDGIVKAGNGWTEIFIYPGFEFKVLDGLVTNFHLPESTLIMLVSAFMGYENTMNAYKIAVEEKYRFFSFGDCMLIISE